MHKKMIMPIFALLLISCSKQEETEGNNTGRGIQDQRPDDNEVLRNEIGTNWSTWEPALNSKSIVQEVAGEYFLDVVEDKRCHYNHTGLNWTLEYLGNQEYNVQRHIPFYTLGSQTTADPAECYKRANGLDNEAIIGFVQGGVRALNLDKISEEKFSNTFISETLENEKLFEEVKLKSITKSSWLDYGSYQISYDVSGRVNPEMVKTLSLSKMKLRNNESFKGVLSFNVLTNTSPAAWVLGLNVNGEVDGQIISVKQKFISKINGITTPTL